MGDELKASARRPNCLKELMHRPDYGQRDRGGRLWRQPSALVRAGGYPWSRTDSLWNFEKNLCYSIRIKLIEKILVKILWSIPLALLFGCAFATSDLVTSNQVENLTPGQITLSLKKGETTQVEVVEKFGSPNLVMTDSEGLEVWTYQRHATVSKESGNSASFNVIIFGARAGSTGFEQSSRAMTLIIKFREINGVKRVSEFSSRHSSF